MDTPRRPIQLKRRMTMLAPWTILLASIGCGTWLGNPKDPGKDQPPSGNSMVSLKIHGELPTVLQLTSNEVEVIGRSGSVTGTLTLTQARVSLKEIKLKTSGSDAEERDLFDGPFVVDLLTSQIRPDPGTISINSGSYANIELKLAKLEKDKISGVVSEGDPLIERSIYLTGTYRPTGGVPVSVTMDFDLDEEFTLGSAGNSFSGMTIVEGQTNPIIIAFQLDRWFNFSSAEADLSDIDGNIVLNKEAEDPGKEVREAIKENIKSSAKFGKDEDGDGELEADEDSEDD